MEEDRRIMLSANEDILKQRSLTGIPEIKGKMLIGIDEANRCNLFGDIIMAMVCVPEEEFKNKMLKLKDSKLLTRKQRDRIFRKMESLVFYQLRKINPFEMESNNINDLEMKYAIDMLNTLPKFWNHKIFINNWEIDKEHFIERFNKLCPANLKNLNLNLNEKNWKIFHGNCKDKASQLASIFARNQWDNDLDGLQNIYGIIGSGSKGDKKSLGFIEERILDLPPFVRKSYNPTKKWLKDANSGNA